MAASQKRRAIVLTVDAWGAGYLGPYGNTWLETPACNQLASEGMLLEHAWVDAPTVEAFFGGVWAGAHAALPSRRAVPSLPETLGRHGISSCLVSDAENVIQHPAGAAFERAELVVENRPSEAAQSAEQTQLARLMASALSTVEDDPADLIWIHSQGMSAAWDAPQDFREQFRDEDDLPIPIDVTPPQGQVAAEVDWDVVQSWIWAYAGQVSLLDCTLEALLESWQRIREPALLIVMGTRGYALAEHGYWGHAMAALHSEHLHVPLLVASNTLDLANVRSQELVQPHHVFHTLLDWFGLDHPQRDENRSLLTLPTRDLRVEGSGWPTLAAARVGDLWSLRTPVWHACNRAAPRGSASAQGPTSRTDSFAQPACQLYLKPDDRWEVNDIADRCRDVVSRFIELQAALSDLAEAAGFESLLPLDPALCRRPE